MAAMMSAGRSVAGMSRGCGIVGSLLAAALLVNAACAVVQGQTTLSIFRKEMEDAEVLYFKGDMARALARLKQAREAIKKERKEADPTLMDAQVDIVEAEILGSQGYLGAATARLTSARDDLTKRGIYYAKKSRATADDLARINFLLGYCDLLRGDLSFVQAHIDSVLKGDAIAIKKCRIHYESGMDIIRTTFKSTGFRDYEVQLRLMNKAEFRFVRLLVIDGDLDRATSYLQDAEQLMKDDFVWILEFVPIGRAGDAMDKATTRRTTAQSRRPQGGGAQGSGNESEDAKKELERRQRKAGKTDGAAANADEPPQQEDQLRASYLAREAKRAALLYLECLAVKTELYLAKAIGEPSFSERAEEAASLARDIAEEKCSGTYHVDRTRLQLAKVYCERHENAIRKSNTEKDDMFDIDGRTTNVHMNAAKTYLDDAREMAELAGERVSKLNPANPLHVELLECELQLASLSKDTSEVERVRRAITQFAEERSQDKPAKSK